MGKEAKILIAVAAVVAVGVSTLILVNGKDTSEVAPKAGGDTLVREDSYQTNKGAPVTVVEFGDYQCPACAAAQPQLEQIKAQYGAKVNVVFRHFPLSDIHPNAKNSAEAAEAAGAQGKFYEMTNALYQQQQQWSAAQNPTNVFVTIAQGLGLDVNQFRSDIESNRFLDKINRDLADANGLKLQATPTFFVNGTQVEDVSGLKAAIDAALKTASPAPAG